MRHMKTRTRWSDLAPQQRRGLLASAIVELILTAFALTDLARRPAGSIRGSKIAWVLACAVQPFGPLAYLLFGRRPQR
jgi:hypothetical protein